MSNRPFSSEGCNLTNEVVYTTFPAAFGNNHLTVRQSKGRTIMDTDHSFIYSTPNHCPNPNCSQQPRSYFDPNIPIFASPTVPNFNAANNNPCIPQNNYCNAQRVILPNQQHNVPGGVRYSFNLSGQPDFKSTSGNFGENILVLNNGSPMRGNVNVFECLPNLNCQKIMKEMQLQQEQQKLHQWQQQHQRTLQQQIAMSNMENRNLEMSLLEQHVNQNPFVLKFHHDGQTDTLDLFGGNSGLQSSRGAPDFKNVSGVMTQTYGADLRNVDIIRQTDGSPVMYCYSSNIRRLNLTKSPDLQPKDLRIDFTPTPEEIQQNESCAKESDKDNNNVQICKNQMCGTNDASPDNCQNFEEDQFFELLEESVKEENRFYFLEDDLTEEGNADQNRNAQKENKDVNTDATNMEDKYAETSKSVTFELNAKDDPATKRKRT